MESCALLSGRYWYRAITHRHTGIWPLMRKLFRSTSSSRFSSNSLRLLPEGQHDGTREVLTKCVDMIPWSR